MRARKYLAQIRKADVLIESTLREMERLRESVMRITAVISDDVVSSTKDPTRHADSICRIVDLENEIDRDIDRLVDLKREVIELIDKVEDARLLDLLYRRYVHFQTWEKIAYEMHYSYRWIHELDKVAVEAFEAVLNAR